MLISKILDSDIECYISYLRHVRCTYRGRYTVSLSMRVVSNRNNWFKLVGQFWKTYEFHQTEVSPLNQIYITNLHNTSIMFHFEQTNRIVTVNLSLYI